MRRTSPEPSTGGSNGESGSEAVAAPGPSDFNPVPAAGRDSNTTSEEIFVEIGQQLRERREMLSLTYEEIERHIHVRTAFLAALEQGALEDLPSPVQTRGILVNYATFLDLDVDAILLRFADALQARYRERGPQRPARSKAPMAVHTTLPPLRSFIASDLVFGGGLIIMLVLFAVWGISRVMAIRSEAVPRATAPSISDVLAGTLPPTLAQQVTVIPAEDTPIVQIAESPAATLELATLNPNVKVQLKLDTTERTYLRVTVDGKVQFDGRTDIGSTYTYEAGNQIEVLVGNASALRVNYNGGDLGLMGNFGQVVDRLYTAEGVATPTSTPQPTRTPTPKVTGTPTETITVTPSVTRTHVP
ncbi:MAG TPA: RodZ domain-containing protein [Anaerolineales bacterium]|nr:RodZ domain-containing protein [Anaerolineales bacterium]